MGTLVSDPIPLPKTNGSAASTVAAEVIKIGLNLAFAALIADIAKLSPCFLRCIANSTIKMAFFANNPTNIINAIWK